MALDGDSPGIGNLSGLRVARPLPMRWPRRGRRCRGSAADSRRAGSVAWGPWVPLERTVAPVGDTGRNGRPGCPELHGRYRVRRAGLRCNWHPFRTYGGPSGNTGYRGAVQAGHGPGHGTFGLGYPGFGLDYVHGSAMAYHRRHYPRGLGDGNWCTDVLGKECLYPYVVDPYSDPAAALGFWPHYSAPVARAASVAGDPPAPAMNGGRAWQCLFSI